MPELAMLTRAAQFHPASVNAEARTAELIWSTGATVRRHAIFGESFDEELSLDDGAVRLGRLNGGAPLLDSHRNYGLDGIVGVVERAWLTGAGGTRTGRAVVRFSDRAEVEPVFRDVAAGIIRNVSVGYQIHRSERIERRAAVPLIRALDWEPIELSLAPVPSDAGAQVRSEEITMSDTSPAPAANLAMPAIDIAGLDRAAATAAERSRVDGITQAGRFLKLERQAGEMITRGISLEVAQSALLIAAAERDEAAAIVRGPRVIGGADHSDPEWQRSAMADALAARICRSAPPEHARQYANCGLLDLMYESCCAAGQRVDRRNVDMLVRAGLHTTSDYPSLLADAANKSLRQMYDAQPSGIRALARQTTGRDFKPLKRLQAGEFPLPLLVNEHGEYTRGSMSESQETYSIATFGRIFGITRQVLVNDDLNALQDPVRKMAVAVNEFVAQQLAAKVAANPLLSDGTATFHVNRGNIGTAAAIDETSVSQMRALMRAQRGLDGQIYVNAVPAFILTGIARETSAEKLIATITPATVATTNVFSGRLANVVDPRITGSPEAWYLVADPATIDGLEYAWLEGSEGPQVESRAGFDVDGVEFKLRVDFGCGWLDYRGWVKNLGI